VTTRQPRLAILASGGGSNMQALAAACADGRIDGRVVVVGCNRPGAPVLAKADAAGIASFALDHRAFASRETFDRALLEQLAPYEPDLVALAGFMRILTGDFIAAFRGRLLNIHPSLLPRYPGLDTHRRAIEAGDAEAGATVHFVTEELDSGPAILQARVPILAGDTPETLAARVLAREHEIYPLAVQWCLSGRAVLDGHHTLLDGERLPPGGVQT
jgi:phosphoribosylglycinamide formyltransferase-1